MEITSINANYCGSFKAAADINLKYILEKHPNMLPERMINEIRKIVSSESKEMVPLYELHSKVYASLIEAPSLDRVKEIFPEYSDVLELSILDGNRTKALKAIRGKGIALNEFTLDFLKKLCLPMEQDKLVEEYGLTNRSLLNWLMDKLNIPRFPNGYTNLIRMSNEEENSRIAELSRRAMFARPAEMRREIQEKVNIHHKTPEYREKKRLEMVNFYRHNPQKAKKVGDISQMTWDKCPEIKDALREYAQQSSPFIRGILRKRQRKQKLTQEESRTIKGYYKTFWDSHPEFVELYRKMRIEAVEEYNKNCLTQL